MDELIIEGVRCFRERQEVPLRPITLLVGENSTGKTTFLAMARLARDMCEAKPPLDFNEEPFLLGGFENVVSFRSNARGPASTFTVGLRVPANNDVPFPIAATAIFTSENTQPVMRQWRAEGAGLVLAVDFAKGCAIRNVTMRTPSGEIRHNRPSFPSDLPVTSVFRHLQLLSPDEGSLVRGQRPSANELRTIVALGRWLSGSLAKRPYALAPIRTRPKRTYDPIGEAPEPEGRHVPMVLANLSSLDPKNWDRLRASLVSFGVASGLFQDVEIRRQGLSASEPFQVKLKIAGPAFNLIDIGYGVSQVLPIIVDALRGERGRTYLLQQPEIHLHPKAQAELASFLAFLAKQDRKQFLVETHSDYLVDRIRMDVRDGKHGLEPEDVSLLFFERRKGSVTIHRLGLDEMGNIVDAPKGYGAFFLTEARRLLQG